MRWFIHDKSDWVWCKSVVNYTTGWCHCHFASCHTYVSVHSAEKCLKIILYVSFIPFFVFGYWSLLTTKLRKKLHHLCLHFARQDGQDGKNRKENHATKVTKIPKTKRRKYGMNQTFMNKQIPKRLQCAAALVNQGSRLR